MNYGQTTTAIKQSIADMEASGWHPINPKDSGSFGKEVHRRVADLFNIDNKAFLGEVWARPRGLNTFEIITIGTEPGVKTGLTNIDVIRLQTNPMGWSPGDVFSTDQVFGAFEIKTSASGTWTSGQEAKYLTVCGGNAKKIGLTLSPRRWSFKYKKFINNINYKGKVMMVKNIGGKIFVYGGLAASAVASIAIYEKMDYFQFLFKDYANKLKSGGFLNKDDQLTEMIFIQDKAIEFFGAMDATGNASGLMKWANPYLVIDQFVYENSYEDFNP